MSLAVVIVSCDRYSWFWPTWYHYFIKNFGFKYPVYLINESTPCDFDGVTQILSPVPGVNYWTKMLREAVKLIPEDDLLIMMDDFVIHKRPNIERIYKTYSSVWADALRIMAHPNKWCKIRYVTSKYEMRFYRLTASSAYKVSFSPNIWRRDYLLKCIARDESPWACELGDGVAGELWYVNVPGWYSPVIHNGNLTPEGKKLKI